MKMKTTNKDLELKVSMQMNLLKQEDLNFIKVKK
jgi:hypothetical protein